MPRSETKAPLSRLLHLVGDASARASVAVVVAVVVVVFVAVLAAAGFPSSWENGFALASSAITLVMVFTIQHTQTRQQSAIQLKLDELIRTSPEADDLLVHIESAHDDELGEIEKSSLEHHASVRSSGDEAPAEH
jgi:low affinity Fe/Cu permease